MHAFMAAVLLGFAGFDEFREDAEADPPGREGGEPSERGGGERSAVIGANPLGQAVFVEESGEDGLGAGGGGGMEGLAAEEISAESVGDGEGEAVESVGGFELSFEVGGPEIVGCEDGAGGLSWMTDKPAAAGFWDHAVALHDVADGGAAGQIPSRMTLVDDCEELLAAPRGMAATGFEEGLNNLGLGFIRRMLRSSGTFFETRWTEPKIAVDPFIGGLARDPVELAEFGDGQGLSQEIGDELGSLVHG